MKKNSFESNLDAILAQIPYIKHLGFRFEIIGDSLHCVLPHKGDLIGNPMLPALHGGVIAAAMEFTAVGELMFRGNLAPPSSSEAVGQTKKPSSSEAVGQTKKPSSSEALGQVKLPKTIDMSIDYLRSGKPQDTFTRAKITKIGRTVANVEVIAWQSDENKPIAKLHGHFLI